MTSRNEQLAKHGRVQVNAGLTQEEYEALTEIANRLKLSRPSAAVIWLIRYHAGLDKKKDAQP
jgi:hypothetical protein